MLLGLFRSGKAELINAQEIICNSPIRTNYFVTDWPVRALSQRQCPCAGSKELQEESKLWPEQQQSSFLVCKQSDRNISFQTNPSECCTQSAQRTDSLSARYECGTTLLGLGHPVGHSCLKTLHSQGWSQCVQTSLDKALVRNLTTGNKQVELQCEAVGEVSVVLKVPKESWLNLHCFFDTAGERSVGVLLPLLQTLFLAAVQWKYIWVLCLVLSLIYLLSSH